MSSRIEAFVATVGVLLIENNPALPWRRPLPEALEPGRGWALALQGGPCLLFVVPADGWDVERCQAAIQAWHALLDEAGAQESVLLLAWQQTPPLPLSRCLPEAESPVAPTVWLVDLEAQRVERTHALAPVDEDGASFAQVIDAYVAAAFREKPYSLHELDTQETARLQGRQPFGHFLSQQRSPAVYTLIGLILAMFALTLFVGRSWDAGTDVETLLRLGANFRPIVSEGEVWRFVSAMFLHGGWVHLGVNLFSLYAIGPLLEKLYGTPRFLSIYLFAGLTGALASFTFLASAPSVGASGAIFGILGAMWVLGWHHRDWIPDHQKQSMRQSALIMVILNLGIGFSQRGTIDNYAHIGGLLGGAALAALLGPHPALSSRAPWPAALKPLSRLGFALLPVAASLTLGYGVWHTLSRQISDISVVGPTDDYRVTLPLADLRQTNTALIDQLGSERHALKIESEANWLGAPDARALEAHVASLARHYAVSADGARLVGDGERRFLRFESGHEEIYLTASPARLYVIRTQGLRREPWVARARDKALSSFTPLPPPRS